MKNLRILITGSGGPAAISFFKASAHDGIDFFMADIDYRAAGLYLVPKDRRAILRRGEDAGFVGHLLEVCKRFEIDVLIPTVDSELLPIARSIELFEDAGVSVLIADEPTIDACLDKYALFEHCKHHVPVPATFVYDKNFDVDGIRFPMFVKPRTGSGSRGVLKVSSPEDLSGLPKDCSLLIQEFLPGKEYSVDVIADRAGMVLASVPRERMKIDSGIAVTSRSVKDSNLQTLAETVAKRIGLKYIANIQFRLDKNGEPRLLEVNPRFPGTMPLTVASGVNMPMLALREVLGMGNDFERFDWKETVMVRMWEEHYVPAEEIETIKAAGLRANLSHRVPQKFTRNKRQKKADQKAA